MLLCFLGARWNQRWW